MRVREHPVAYMLGHQALYDVVYHLRGLGDRVRQGLQGRGSFLRLPAVLADLGATGLEMYCAVRVVGSLYGFGGSAGIPFLPGPFDE